MLTLLLLAGAIGAIRLGVSMALALRELPRRNEDMVLF